MLIKVVLSIQSCSFEFYINFSALINIVKLFNFFKLDKSIYWENKRLNPIYLCPSEKFVMIYLFILMINYVFIPQYYKFASKSIKILRKPIYKSL